MFRVGDIVERIGHDLFGQKVGKQYTVSDVAHSQRTILVEGGEIRYSVNNYKLIKPVWAVGDRAKVVRDTITGHEFTVSSVSEKHLFDTSSHVRSYWHKAETCERVALAPSSISPLDLAALQFAENLQQMKNDGPTVAELVSAGFLPELKTTLARENYLSDVLEVKARLIPGNVAEIEMVQRWSVRLEVESLGNTVAMHNIDHVSLDAERLRKLAKLCTDLADLMG